MSAESDDGMNKDVHAADSEAASMKDRLSKEVATWSKERRQQSGKAIVERPASEVQRHSLQSAGDPRKPTAPLPAGKAAGARSKPFGMSYAGMTQAEYTQYLRDRGRR